jgi:hypothetical protein
LIKYNLSWQAFFLYPHSLFLREKDICSHDTKMFNMNLFFNVRQAGHQGLTPVILATQEANIRRSVV